MPHLTTSTIDGIAYREALPEGWDGSEPVALAIHGYPTSSYLWRNVLPRVAEAGYRALALDLPGFGDSPADPPGTWERQVENVERFRQALGLERLALLVHDWGGLIGLRWACDHPEAVSAIVIMDSGFFHDGHWHGIAVTLQTEGEGEQFLANVNRDLMAAALRQISATIPEDAIDEFWKAYADEERRRNQLDLYRSGQFSKLEPYEGKLAALGVPVLLLWGGNDRFAPVRGAYRFQKELPDTRLVVLEEAGHYVMEDDPTRVGEEVSTFLAGCAGATAERG